MGSKALTVFETESDPLVTILPTSATPTTPAAPVAATAVGTTYSSSGRASHWLLSMFSSCELGHDSTHALPCKYNSSSDPGSCEHEVHALADPLQVTQIVSHDAHEKASGAYIEAGHSAAHTFVSGLYLLFT